MSLEQFIGTFWLPLAMLFVALGAGARGVWVWGRELKSAIQRAERAERDSKEWKEIALKALGYAERVVK